MGMTDYLPRESVCIVLAEAGAASLFCLMSRMIGLGLILFTLTRANLRSTENRPIIFFLQKNLSAKLFQDKNLQKVEV